ncbi:hypothetical protein WME77_34465 [Sorangium sp. So ce764]|uniref:hypothetical protein n=1 Tax=Sorangium sp. So ce764 TaxID=3133320 RepID=UPI003F6083FC
MYNVKPGVGNVLTSGTKWAWPDPTIRWRGAPPTAAPDVPATQRVQRVHLAEHLEKLEVA